MKQKLSLIIITLASCLAARAYTVSPACPDFTDINASYVEAFTGNVLDPFMSQGVVSGRHTLITAQGTDPNTGGALQLLPAGESQVVRLGNQNVHAEAEALIYHFIVDKNNPVLLVKFAVVLEDPNHPSFEQPRFVIRITDKDGNLTEECAEYDVSARPDIPGFQSYQGSFYSPVRWRDWTNVGLDLSPYIGQEVQVQFITYDCYWAGHYGYAYFTASCIPNRLQLDGCTGSQFTLEAPKDFESYLWSNGATTRTTTFNSAASNDAQITCTVTSATGCQFPLYAFVTSNSGGITSGSYTDIICEGETYNKYHFDLPPQEVGTHHYQNIIVNPATCNDDKVIDLELKVVKRYNQIEAAICQGESYEANGFKIILPATGVRRDTIETGTIGDCKYYNVLKLTVNANLNMPDLIKGDASPCSNELVTYSFAGAETLTYFEWILPDNAVLYKSSRFAQQITLYYKDDTAGTLSLSGQNGCGSATTNLPVHPRLTHNVQLSEETCQGSDFGKYNFNLGVQDSVGYFVYEKHLQSSLGCDSTVILALNVLPTPVVRIEPKDAVLCNPGDEITLWALTDSMKYANIPEKNENEIPCGDYDDWYNTLTPTDVADFALSFITAPPFIVLLMKYTGTNEKVVIPAINTIDIQAFQGSNITEVVIPSTVTAINSEAFNNCTSLSYVTVPANVTTIANNAFSNCPNLTIRCYKNSYAHQYAIDNKIKFELIEKCNTEDYPFTYIYDCDLTYLWNTGDTTGVITQNPTATTEYSVIVTTQGSCSASAKQTVIVNTHAPQTVYDTICAGDVYQKYGLNATATGIYSVQITEDDCSFTLNVDLKVNERYEGKIIDVVCAGEPYRKHNLDFTLIQPGVFRDTLHFLRSTGCDSIIALEITVKPAVDTLVRDTVCQYQSYNGKGFKLSAQDIAGEFTYTRTSKTPQNCDSTIILNLTVIPVYTAVSNIISDEVERDSTYNKYNFNFAKVTKDTTATKTGLISSSGCDSTVVLNLNVLCVNDTLRISDSIFVGEDYYQNGFKIPVQNTDTMLLDTLFLRNKYHCDSIVILTLKVKIIMSSTECPNGTVIFREDFDRYGDGLNPASPRLSVEPLPVGRTTYQFTYSGDPGDGWYALAKYNSNYNTGNPFAWSIGDDNTSFGDNTIGRFMLVNADHNPGVFYSHQIDDLCPDSKLYFSAMVANCHLVGHNGILPNLTFLLSNPITEKVITSYDTDDIPYANKESDWQKYGFSFDVPGGVTSVLLEIINNQAGGGGNDLGIDDIEIRLCTPPVTVDMPDDAICVGSPAKLTGIFVNDGTFIEPLEYRWLKSATGDLTSQASWATVGNTLTLDFPSVTAADSGYYRLAIAGAGSIGLENCRAMSDPVFLAVKECHIDYFETGNNIQILTCYDNTILDILNDTTIHCNRNDIELTITSDSKVGATVTVDSDNNIVYAPANGFTGHDTLEYNIICSNKIYEVKAFIIVAKCPDNIVEVDCYGEPPVINWDYQLLMTSPTADVVNHFSIPLVGDIDNDGKTEIVVPAIPATGYTIFTNAMYIFEVNDNTITRQQRLDIPYINLVNNSYSIANVDGGSYAALFIATSVTGNTTAAQGQLIKYVYNGTQYVESWRQKYTNLNTKESPQPMIADFNNDGIAEVLVYDKVFNARTGELLIDAGYLTDVSKGFGLGGHMVSGHSSWVPAVPFALASMMAVADIDEDGIPEVIGGNCVYKVNIVNTTGITGNSFMLYKQASIIGHLEVMDGATTVADMDGDGLLDVIVTTAPPIGNAALYVWNPRTGEVINNNIENTIPKYVGGGAYCGASVSFIGDIDNDGQPEICLTGRFTIRAYNYNATTKLLTQKWNRTTSDDSGATAMVMFDFDQDGRNELVYRDQTNLRIINGIDGTNKVVNSIACYSSTGNEYPVVVDINNDGAAEIVVVGANSNSTYETTTRVMVFSSKNEHDKWAPTRKVWNQFAYNVVNVNNDLTIPRYQMNPATFFPNGKQPYNGYLMQQTLLNTDGDPFWTLPNVEWTSELEATSTCDSIIFAGCIANIGDAALQAPIYITFYKDDTIPENIISMDSIQNNLMVNDTLCFEFTINNLSGYAPFSSIWVSINDRNGEYPYQAQCVADGRREIPIYYNLPVSDTICQGDSVFFGNQYYKLPDTYCNVLKTKLDYDSIVALNLVVKNCCVNDTIRISDSIFVGKDYDKNGFKIPIQNKDTILLDTLRLPKLNSCDSIVILNLKVSKYYYHDTIYMRDCDLPRDIFMYGIVHADSIVTIMNYEILQSAQLPGASFEISGVDWVYIPPTGNDTIVRDEIIYEFFAYQGAIAIPFNMTITIIITPCHIAPMSIDFTPAVHCLDDTCRYEGPSILINEVMINPTKYDGAIYGQQCIADSRRLGGEWIELYNPNSCDSVDISGYFMANSTIDHPLSGWGCRADIAVRDIGAAFVLPEGTVIPPNGFCVLRGERAAVVDSARLVQNGGNTVVIDLVEYFDRFCLDNTGYRFWLPNVGGWFGFYDRNGIAQDVIYWGNPAEDICADCTPCNPLIPGSYTGKLASLNDIPAERKTRIVDFDLESHQGNTPKRIPDGGAWQINTITPPTQGFCNGSCVFRTDNRCGGTATVTVHKSGNYSYLWNDANGQTTPTATGLCEGTYCCTVTNEDTGLSEFVCTTLTADFIEPDKIFIYDTIFVGEDYYENGFKIPVQHTDTTILDTLFLKKNPTRCDSLVILELIVKPLVTVPCTNDTVYISAAIFVGEDYYKDGFKIPVQHTDTTILDTLFLKKEQTLCDSLVVLELIVKPLVIVPCTNDTVYISAAIFVGEDYYENGFKIPVQHTETTILDTLFLQNKYHCDSLVFLTLIVKTSGVLPCTPPSVIVVEKTICQNDTVHLIFTGIAPFDLNYSFNGIRKKMTALGMDTILIATQSGNNQFIVHRLVSGDGCSLLGEIFDEDGVEINGLIWATRNVDAPGTFAANPEDAGMFYQWNSAVGWSSTDPLVSTNGSSWNGSWNGNGATVWETTNNVCPADWRVPTIDDMKILFDDKKISDEWIQKNGVYGAKLTDKISGNSIFMPASGYRYGDYGSLGNAGDLLYVGGSSIFWSSTADNTGRSYDMGFESSNKFLRPGGRNYGLSVRCVKDAPEPTGIIFPIIVYPIKHETISAAICANDSILFNGNYYKEAEFYTDTVSSEFGCDSIVTLILKILQLDTISILENICDGDSYFFNGMNLYNSGIYFEKRSCDSVMRLELKVHQNSYQHIHKEIVEGEKYIFNGQELRAEGIYSETFVSAQGCDSVVVLYLSVLPKVECPEIEIPMYFRPNTNGLSEFWKIKNIECYKYRIYLYDRFSKELFVWENNFPIQGWDGMYLGKPMPSTDYWYLIVLEGIRDYVGHFTLLR